MVTVMLMMMLVEIVKMLYLMVNKHVLISFFSGSQFSTLTRKKRWQPAISRAEAKGTNVPGYALTGSYGIIFS